VLSIDAAANRIVVGPRAAAGHAVRLRDVNWLVPPAPLRCTVKLRAREAPHPATVRPTAEGAVVTLDRPALAAPGQACVFYLGERVLGGGFICRPNAVDAPGVGAAYPAAQGTAA
jgi:tRNA-uridine 2-sulfurtransferase